MHASAADRLAHLRDAVLPELSAALERDCGGAPIALTIDFDSFAAQPAAHIDLLARHVLASIVTALGWIAAGPAGRTALTAGLSEVRVIQAADGCPARLSLEGRCLVVCVDLSAASDAFFISTDIRHALAALVGQASASGRI